MKQKYVHGSTKKNLLQSTLIGEEHVIWHLAKRVKKGGKVIIVNAHKIVIIYRIKGSLHLKK